MNITRLAGIMYAAISAGVVAFQIAMALGAPWGSYAMGGVFPGRFPMEMRVLALLQVAILLFWVAIILARAGIAFPRWSHSSRWLAWVAVAFAAIGLLLNLITPSAGERIIWAPVALILLGCSLLVASSPADQIR